MNGNKNDSQPVKIILVEDNPDDLEIIRDALKRDNERAIDLHIYVSLKDAFKTLESKQFDMVLFAPCEIDSDTRQSVQQLLFAVPGLPVVVLAQKYDTAFVRWCNESGAVYLPKEKRTIEKLSLIIYNLRARAAVHKRDAHMRTILENIADGTLAVNKQGYILFCNTAAEKLLGYPATELIGTSFGYPIGSDTPLEIDLPRRTGGPGTAEMRATETILDGEDCYIVTLRDITERMEMEKELSQLKDYLQLQINRMPIGLIVWDTEFRMKSWNPAAERIFNYTAEEVLGKHPYDIIVSKEVQPQVDQIWQRLLEGDEAANSINENMRKDGSLIICEWTNTPLRKEDGSIIGVLSMVQDITERKRMEMVRTAQYNISSAMITVKELRAFFEVIQNELNSLIDTRNFILALYDEKKDLFITQFARDEKDLIIPSWSVKKSLTGQLIKKKKSLLLHRKEIKELAQRGEIEIMGTVPEVWLGIPLFSDEKIIGALVLQNYENPDAYDISTVEMLEVISYGLGTYISLKHAEESRERLSTAIEQAAEAVIITDPQGNIEYVNPAFEHITGYSRSEVLGENPRILKSGKHDIQFYRELWETISNGQTWHGKLVNRHKDGSLYTEKASISPVFDSKGNIVHYVAVKRDVTREEEMEQRLLQAKKMEAIGRLAGGVAHDFNNMLNIIIGYGEILLYQLEKNHPWYEMVQQILNAANRSASLTDQLLAFSRKQIIQPKVIKLNEVLINLEKMLQRLIGEDIDLKMHLSEDLNLVEIDPVQIEQILMNLAVNARDAMPYGGKLFIKTKNVFMDEDFVIDQTAVKPGEYVLLSVSDTGVGMDEESLSRIFEPFFTTKEMGKGTGLGLATVYGIVKQSKGYIKATSLPDHGTSFDIYLPVAKGKQDKDDTETTEEIRIVPHKTVLVVEDEKSLRELALTSLAKMGYQVSVASNSSEAIFLVEKEGLKPDILVTDVIMPGMSGAMLAERLKEKIPNLKILFMSGYTNNAIAHHGVLNEGTSFIQKPFSFRDLAAKIREVLEKASDSSSI